MGSLPYVVQVLYKLVSLRNRLELGWIQESQFVPALVKFHHGAFVFCSLVFIESDLALPVEQITSSASLTEEQVLNLEAVEAYDDWSWLSSYSRLGCKAPVGTIELRWCRDDLRSKDINKQLGKERS